MNLTYASVPPFLSMILPRHVNTFLSFSLVKHAKSILCWAQHLSCVENVCMRVVLGYHPGRHSVSKVHWISFPAELWMFFRVRPITRSSKGGSNQPCFNPGFVANVSVTFPLWTFCRPALFISYDNASLLFDTPQCQQSVHNISLLLSNSFSYLLLWGVPLYWLLHHEQSCADLIFWKPEWWSRSRL